MTYSDLPWVKPIDAWLGSQGNTALTWIGLGLAAVTIAIALFAPASVKLFWLAYMFAP